MDGVQDVKSYSQEETHVDKEYDEPQLNVGGQGATQRRLKNYQITMIGFCSGIGTGLFIGSGAAYANAGPAGLLLAFTIVGVILWCVMQSISELATLVSWAPQVARTYQHTDHSVSSQLPVLSHIGQHDLSTLP